MDQLERRTAGSGQIRGFDGLRAISIALVLLQHYDPNCLLPATPFMLQRVWPLISGDTGVNIFFVLSGFLITRLLLTERAAKGRIDLRRFYIRRFLRLTPPLVLFLALTAVLMIAGLVKVKAYMLLVVFFYLYNYVPAVIGEGELAHTWSLAVEEQFYLIWPMLLAFLGPRPARRVAWLLLLLVPLALWLLPSLQVPWKGEQVPLSHLFLLRRWFIPAAGPIMIGALTAMALHGLEAGSSRWRLVDRGIWAMVPLYLASLYLPDALRPLAFMFQAVGVALLLAWITRHPMAGVVKALEFRPLAYIGKISYGLYLYHVLVIGTRPSGRLIDPVPLSLLVILALTIASFELYEKPILRLKERFR